MRIGPSPRTLRRTAPALGAVLAMAMLATGWLPEQGGGALALTVTVARTGALDVSPVGVAVSTPELGGPGEGTERSVTVSNLTALDLTLTPVVVSTLPGPTDEMVTLDIFADGEPVAAGDLAALTEGDGGFQLASGASVEVDVLAERAADATDWRGRVVDVELRFDAVDGQGRRVE